MSDTEKIEVIELAAYQAALDEIERLKRELWSLKEQDGRPYPNGEI